ncbi:MAG: SWIM zinc finger family protein [Saprospiraceae bacterium]|nr:SWIM zinc finger family protein [Saprospiraceae bacterium]
MQNELVGFDKTVLTCAFFTTARRKYKMKLNFSLDKLELYLDDDILLAADQLISIQHAQSLIEIEKNLFLLRTTEGGDAIETEVQLSGSKVKMATCECQAYQENNICSHIGAALLLLLEKKKIQAETKKAAPPKQTESHTEGGTKLTIPNILKRIEPNLLIEFIANYARSDKQFALALKTRFASDLSAGSIQDHYKTLIDNTLRTVKNPKGRITPKGWQQVFTMLDELRQKAESFFKAGELNSCFELLKVTLPLIHRLMRAYDSPKAKLERRQIQLTEILRGFDGLLVSPELSQNLWDFVLVEYTQNVRHDYSSRLFDWLLKHADNSSQIEGLLQTLDTQINMCRQFVDIRDRLITQKVQLLHKIGRIEEASALILSASSSPDVLLTAIQNTFNSGDYDLAKSLCENGLKVFKRNAAATQTLEEWLLTIAENEADTEGVIFYAEKRLLATFNYTFYDKLQQLNLPTDKRQAIIKAIENQSYRIEKRDLLAAIYLEEKQLDKLTQMIVEMQSLELLRRYGVALYELDGANKGESVVDLHKKVMYEYLYTHLGRPPAQRIRQVLESQISQNGMALAERLKKELKKDFPERYSLNEELEDMMEEIERRATLIR